MKFNKQKHKKNMIKIQLSNKYWMNKIHHKK